MTNSDDIIKDLLKKIDNLQETINMKNAFIMRMATYRDEREDQWEQTKSKRLKELADLAMETGAIDIISKWLLDIGRTSQRPPYSAGQPESDPSEGREDFDS